MAHQPVCEISWEDTKYDYLTIQRLERGWKCVLSQFQKQCSETSLNTGAGIFLFKFLPKESATSSVNCERAYIPKENYIFDSLVNSEPCSAEIKRSYDPEFMYLISVHVPITNSPHRTVGSIKAFSFGDDKEISFRTVKG